MNVNGPIPVTPPSVAAQIARLPALSMAEFREAQQYFSCRRKGRLIFLYAPLTTHAPITAVP